MAVCTCTAECRERFAGERSATPAADCPCDGHTVWRIANGRSGQIGGGR